MTQEEKDLLIKDLCARLPYGINCEYQGKVHGIVGFNHGKVTIYEHFQSEPKFPFIEEVKLYLFPLSSMTEEQYEKFIIISGWDGDIEDIRHGKFSCIGYVGLDYIYDTIDWFNKNHFDIYGLIPMGLAIDATGLNVY